MKTSIPKRSHQDNNTTTCMCTWRIEHKTQQIYINEQAKRKGAADRDKSTIHSTGAISEKQHAHAPNNKAFPTCSFHKSCASMISGLFIILHIMMSGHQRNNMGVPSASRTHVMLWTRTVPTPERRHTSALLTSQTHVLLSTNVTLITHSHAVKKPVVTPDSCITNTNPFGTKYYSFFEAQ